MWDFHQENESVSSNSQCFYSFSPLCSSGEGSKARWFHLCKAPRTSSHASRFKNVALRKKNEKTKIKHKSGFHNLTFSSTTRILYHQTLQAIEACSFAKGWRLSLGIVSLFRKRRGNTSALLRIASKRLGRKPRPKSSPSFESSTSLSRSLCKASSLFDIRNDKGKRFGKGHWKLS